jgi:hypothetical protein
LLNPFSASALVRAGIDQLGLQRRIWEAASASTATLRRFGPGILSEQDRSGPSRTVHVVPCPTDVVIVVCGAPGDYSVVMPTWGAPVDLCQPVTKKVRESPVCEI